jgi:cell division protein FtsN
MARARARRKRSRSRAGLPRWTVIGALLLVLAGAAAWYLRSRDSSSPPAGPPASTKESPKPPPPPPQPVESRDRFEFYDVLPDQEVRVGGEPADRAGDPAPAPVVTPGAYVIQAGAFPNFAEADKVKARLALLGVVAEIQQAESNGTVYHRVRIGPIENLDRLNQLRARLKQNRIEFLVIPVGE